MAVDCDNNTGLTLGLTFFSFRDIMFHFSQRVEQLPRYDSSGDFYHSDEKRRASDGRADDLRVDRGHFSTTQSFVRFLVSEVTGCPVVAVSTAGQRQVVSEAPVVTSVVGTTTPQSSLDPSKRLQRIRVRLRIVVSIVHCVLYKPVRVFTINKNEDQNR